MPDMHDRTEVVMRTKGPKRLQDEAVGASPTEEFPISEVDHAEYGFSFQHVTSDIAFLHGCYDSMPVSTGDALSLALSSESPHAVDDSELDEPPVSS